MSYSVLCTGSSGLVASRFAHKVGIQGIPFYGIDVHGSEESVDILNPENLFAYVKKVFDESKEQKRKPVLFHFAAVTFTGYDLTPEQIDLAWEVNVDGTQNVVEVCKQLNIPLVHISTDYVFAGANKTTPYIPEDDVFPDETVYALTKARAEIIVLEASVNLPVAIVRIAFPYGNPDHPKQGLVRKMLEWMETKPQVSLYNDQIICPTPIDFIAQNCIKIAELFSKEELKLGNIFHVVGKPTTPFELGKIVKEVYKKETELVPTSVKSNGPKNLVLDTKSTEEKLGLVVPDHKTAIEQMYLS